MKRKLAIAFALAILLSTGVASASNGQVTLPYLQAQLAAITAQIQNLIQEGQQAGLLPDLGSDFAGGIVPSNLFSASVANNNVTPNLPNLLVNGALSAGGTAANNQIPVIYTAIATYPGQTAATIPSSTFLTAATTTQVSFSAAGFSIGDPCEVQYNFTTSTLLSSANVTAVSGSSVTTTVQFLNLTGATVSETVTSTITGASSTIKATCFATGV